MMKIFRLDFHVVQILLQRGWNIIAGGITLLAIPLFLTQTEQGYYYTFQSVLALHIFFELGLNNVIIQFVGHESARMTFTENGKVLGPQINQKRLNSLISILHRWYAVAAFLFLCVIGPSGYLFFAKNASLDVDEWLTQWVVLIFFTGINLYLSWYLAVLEGVGLVAHVARTRLVQSMMGHALMWLLLFAGAGLFSVIWLPLISVLYSWYRIRNYSTIFKVKENQISDAKIDWKTEIFPMHWRVAISWISGYFIFNAFTPFVFSNQGASEAGKLGLSLTIFTAITNLGTAWSSANTPKMTKLIALGCRDELNKLFLHCLKYSFAFTFVACCGFLFLANLADRFDIAVLKRISSQLVLISLTIVALSNVFIFTAAGYMRAHKEEPLLIPSLVGGVLNFFAAYFGSKVSSELVVGLYAVFTLFLGVPWTWIIFKNYYKANHR